MRFTSFGGFHHSPELHASPQRSISTAEDHRCDSHFLPGVYGQLGSAFAQFPAQNQAVFKVGLLAQKEEAERLAGGERTNHGRKHRRDSRSFEACSQGTGERTLVHLEKN